MKKSLLLLCVSLIFMFTLTGFAQANTSESAKVKAEKRLEIFNNIVTDNIHNNSPKKELYNQLKQNGFELVSKEEATNNDQIEINSAKSNVDLPTAQIFRDNNNPSQYVASGLFLWKDHKWDKDIPIPYGSSGNVGGDDLFGIAFSKKVNILSKNFQTWDNFSIRKINTDYAAEQSSYGVAFEEPDRYFEQGTKYTWDSGFISVYFTPQQTGQYTAWQTMGHTWSNADISSVSIGAGGISVNFSNSNYSWRSVAPKSAKYTF